MKMMKKRALPIVVILAFLSLPTPAPAFPLMGVGLVRQLADVSEYIVRTLTGVRTRTEPRVRDQQQRKEGSCVDPNGRPRPCN
jgi:hypothetical protein